MRFEQTDYFTEVKKVIRLDEGTFYIAESYVVGEINEGAHFNWDVAQKVIDEVYLYFGSKNIDIAYISNRVFTYSISPVDWLQFFQNKHKLSSINIVSYRPSGIAFYFLEKLFIKTRLYKFESLTACIVSLKDRNVNNVFQFEDIYQEHELIS